MTEHHASKLCNGVEVKLGAFFVLDEGMVSFTLLPTLHQLNRPPPISLPQDTVLSMPLLLLD